MKTAQRLIALFGLLLIALAARPAAAQMDQAQVVNSAQAAIERLKTSQGFQEDFQKAMQDARGVLAVPSFYKGGFILGGQYGNGVLLARRADGSWSYPAFFTMTGGSFGLQIGLESTAVVFVVRTDKAVQALLNNQFKLGADAGVTFVIVGAGLGASTTSNLGADVVAFALSGVGLYGGLALDGTVVSARESWNAAYYGQNVSSRAIILDNAASNPQADRLRDVLAR